VVSGSAFHGARNLKQTIGELQANADERDCRDAGGRTRERYARAVTDRVEWITDRARFDELAEEWDRLADAARRPPFSRHAWFESWLDAFGPVDLRMCVLWRADAMAAAVPLRAMRSGARTIANVHTPSLRPLGVDSGAITDVYREAAEQFSELVIEPLPEEFVETHSLVEAAHELGLWTVVEPQHTSPFVETDGDFGEWRAGSKPHWGAPLERFRRKAARERRAELDLVFSPKDLDSELDECLVVEASGWKGEHKTAILSRSETRAFYQSVAAAFHERGELRLSTLRLDGKLAAFDLCLLHRRRLYLLKTGYDESFRKLAPGLVLQLSVIERCFETEVEAFELLGGDTEWKRKFSTDEREHVALRSFRKRPAPAVRYAYRRALRPGLRRAYRKVRGL
jgi:CelD/BcsL family acetyltransferase involved in cellulose biosynthesis